MSKIEKICVYNKFSLDAVFAAAFVKKLLPQFVLVDSTRKIPVEATSILWLGIGPEKGPFGSKSSANDGTANVIFLEPIVGENSFESITKQVIVKSGMETDAKVINLINGAIQNFYNKNASFEDLLFTFVNLKVAEDIIATNSSKEQVEFKAEDFFRTEFNKLDRDRFSCHIRSMKQKINNNYRIQNIEFKDKIIRAFVTSIQDDWVWVKRMVLLANHKYANINITPNGCIIDTNLPSLKTFVLDTKIRESNVY